MHGCVSVHRGGAIFKSRIFRANKAIIKVTGCDATGSVECAQNDDDDER